MYFNLTDSISVALVIIYGTALSVKELDFDPIDMVKDKVKEELKSKIRENLIN